MKISKKLLKASDPKSRIKRLMIELDALARSKVMERDKVCQRTGCKSTQTVLQWCHVFSRSILSVRWDEDNAVALHPGCHNFWAHKYPDEFYEAVKAKIGTERWEALVLKKNTSYFKRSVSNLELKLASMR